MVRWTLGLSTRLIKKNINCVIWVKSNFLYTNISKDEFINKYLKFEKIINPEFVIIAEDEGEIVGYFFGFHDYYCKSEKRLILKTLSRKKDNKYVGLGSVLSKKITEVAKNNNYQSILHAFLEEKNQSKKISEKFSGKNFREYKLYAKKIF